MNGTPAYRAPHWTPWTWRLGGPLSAAIWIELGQPIIGLVVLSYSVMLDLRWRLGRRHA